LAALISERKKRVKNTNEAPGGNFPDRAEQMTKETLEKGEKGGKAAWLGKKKKPNQWDTCTSLERPSQLPPSKMAPHH